MCVCDVMMGLAMRIGWEVGRENWGDRQTKGRERERGMDRWTEVGREGVTEGGRKKER